MNDITVKHALDTFLYSHLVTDRWIWLFSQDFFTGGQFQPPKDSQQDYNLIHMENQNGIFIMTFERKRDTGDSKDVQFTVSHFTTQVLNI